MATGLRIEATKDSHKGRWIVGMITIVLLALSAWFGFRYYTTGQPLPIPIALATANPTVDETEVTDEAKQTHEVAPNLPRYISIPQLDIVNARVMSMGITQTGELATPANINDVGWYEKSALPGTGSSAMLLDGHNGGPTKGGVFEDLPSLKPGDEVTIERGDGELFTYEVRDVEEVTVEELNNGGMEKLSNSADEAYEGLNIISCTGNWVPALQTYDKRVVVRAVAV